MRVTLIVKVVIIIIVVFHCCCLVAVDGKEIFFSQYLHEDDPPISPAPSTPRLKAATVKRSTPASVVRQQLLQHLSQPLYKQQNIDSLPTVVMVRLIPIKIQDLNEKTEVLEMTIRLQLTWQDTRLAWEPKAFNNVSEIVIPGSILWMPDIAILNNIADIYHVVRDTRFEMKLESDGRVWWHPTGIIKTYCKMHLRYFPLDRQNCSIVLESPTLDIKFMNLTLRSKKDPVDLAMYIGGETWDLLGVMAVSYLNRVTTRTTFGRVEFWVQLERAKIYHLLNVILPAIFLSCVQVMFFLLPARHPQRVGSSSTTLLSVVVFQTVAASQLPKTSTDVPLLAVYVFIVTFISGLSVCTAIFVSKFAAYADDKQAVPKWLRIIPKPAAIFRRFFMKCGCREKKKKELMTLPPVRPTTLSLHGVVFSNKDAESLKNIDDKSSSLNIDSPPLAKSEIVAESLALVAAADDENKDDDAMMFNSWSDVSQAFDMFLFLLAVVIAISSPVLLFLVIPRLVAE